MVYIKLHKTKIFSQIGFNHALIMCKFFMSHLIQITLQTCLLINSGFFFITVINQFWLAVVLYIPCAP